MISDIELVIYREREGAGNETLLGLCWVFGLLILPVYERYRKDYQKVCMRIRLPF
jgi:hypothetical protein